MIEIRYVGAVVGRSSIIRELDTRGLFLGMTEPLPLGTAVDLKIDEQIVSGRVEQVCESQELGRAGMRVRFSRPESAPLFGIPAEASPEVVPPLWFSTQPAAHDGRASHPPNGAAAVVEAPMELPATQSGPRRIVVDASSEKPPDSSSVEASAAPADVDVIEGDLSAKNGASAAATPEGSPSEERIPAPDPSALGGGGGAGGRKNRRNRRR